MDFQEYDYDTAGRLISEKSQLRQVFYEYTYDTNNNIKTVKDRVYPNGTVMSTHTYNYTNGKDKLTSLVLSATTKSFTTDALGNHLRKHKRNSKPFDV